MIDVETIIVVVFLSIISTNFNIIVDRIIGAPGHGKYAFDGINACDKRYLIGKYI